jgi:hypothetical protein
MIDLSGFKREIMTCGLAVGGIIAVGSLFILGADLRFLAGLGIGTAITYINFQILVYSGKKSVEERRRGPVIVGYGVRLPIYAVGLILAIQVGMHCMAGCAIAFFETQIAMFYLYGIRKRPNPFKDWDDDVKFNNPHDWDDEEDKDDDWGVPPSWDRSDKFLPPKDNDRPNKEE